MQSSDFILVHLVQPTVATGQYIRPNAEHCVISCSALCYYFGKRILSKTVLSGTRCDGWLATRPLVIDLFVRSSERLARQHRLINLLDKTAAWQKG